MNKSQITKQQNKTQKSKESNKRNLVIKWIIEQDKNETKPLSKIKKVETTTEFRNLGLDKEITTKLFWEVSESGE